MGQNIGQKAVKYILVLTQIRNIRKTILPTQMPLTILKTCVSISAMKHPHVTFAPSFPPPSPLYTSQPGSQIETLEMITTPSTLAPSWWWFRLQIPSYQQTMVTSSSILFQEFQNYHANIETHSLIFENDNTAISTPPYPKPGLNIDPRVPKLSCEHWDAFPHIRKW